MPYDTRGVMMLSCMVMMKTTLQIGSDHHAPLETRIFVGFENRLDLAGFDEWY